MIYLFLILSIILNFVFAWYIRKILTKYWYDLEARKSFIEMLSQFEESLTQIYKLEEFYGEETLKKAIQQTRFVVQACKEFSQILEKETIEEAEALDQDDKEDEESEESETNKKEKTIKLKEGESISQDASSYRRVERDNDPA